MPIREKCCESCGRVYEYLEPQQDGPVQCECGSSLKPITSRLGYVRLAQSKIWKDYERNGDTFSGQ